MKKILTSVLLVSFSLACVLLILLFSPIGLRGIISIHNHYSDNPIQYRRIHGNILGPIRIQHLYTCSAQACINAQSVYISWSPSKLLSGKIVIDDVRSKNIVIHQNKAILSLPKAKSHKRKPLHWSIKRVFIRRLTFNTPSQHSFVFQPINLKSTQSDKEINFSFKGKLIKPTINQYKIDIHGAPDDYNIEIDAQGGSSHLHWHGTGSQTGIKLVNSDHILAKGSMTSQIDFRWAPILSWNLDIHAKDILASTWNSTWPSPINLNIHSQGTIKNKKPNISLSAIGNTPNNHLSISGKISTQNHLSWDITSNKLSEIIPDLFGTLTSHGTITGFSLQPTIDASITASQLKYKQSKIKSLASTVFIDLSQKRSSNLKIKASSLNGYNHDLKDLELQANGTLKNYSLTGIIQHQLATLSIALQGSYLPSNWKNHFNTLQLKTSQFGQWKLTHPFTITKTQSHIDSDAACFTLTDHPSNQSCVEAHWQSNQNWSGTLSSHGVTITQLTQPFLPDHTTLSGLLELNAQASGTRKNINQLSLTTSVDQGKITYHDRTVSHTIPINQAKIDSNYHSKQLHSTIHLTLEPNNSVQTDFTIKDFSRLSMPKVNQLIEGSLSIKADDLQSYNPFIPNIDIKKGSINSSLKISGPIKSASIQGESSLKNIKVFLPKIGLAISDMNFSLFNQGHTTNYSGTIHSNDTALNFKGNSQFKNDQWLSSLHLYGADFNLINNEEYSISASPDLTVNVANKDININGKIDIPRAIIAPYRAKNVKHLPHNDIQYYTESVKNPWLVHGKVDLNLGSNININIIGINGKATGNLTVSKLAQGSTLCNGNIFIDGLYEAYGHKLKVSPHSMLSYNNSPITNPILNLKATKTITNSNQLYQQNFSANNIIVGVEVTGLLDQPNISLFSIPANLSQSDILSYLILGHVSNYAASSDPTQQYSNNTANIFDTLKLAQAGLSTTNSSGLSNNIEKTLGLNELGVETSSTVDAVGNEIAQQDYFVLGKFIAPKLYLRYSQGLMDSNDILQFKYFITPQWIIQTQADSLDNSNGIDILYTIEH